MFLVIEPFCHTRESWVDQTIYRNIFYFDMFLRQSSHRNTPDFLCVDGMTVKNVYLLKQENCIFIST